MKSDTVHEELEFNENQFIVSKTDKKGRITYCNDLFIEISGYKESELLNQPHNILRHPDMPAVIFKTLWNYLQAGKEIFAYVKNLTKDGKYYWVHAYVTPTYNSSDEIIGYHSVRRKPSQTALKEIIPIYQELLKIEKQSGIGASQEKLDEILKNLELSYDEFSLRFE
jgi:PAS domain S-box-containing protein